jgi:putative membrane protein
MQGRTILAGASCFALLIPLGMAAASLSKADKQFMMEAARADMIAAHEGQMAADHATQDGVKTLAKTLVQDRTTSYTDLSQLAAKTGTPIPKGINAAKDPAIEQLARLKGSGFDRAFTRDEIAATRENLAMFKREAAHGQDADVKAYASKMVPVLEKDLQAAEQAGKPVTVARRK